MNIPDDGQWIFRFDSRSPEEKIKRFIQEKKFYATLPHKIDNAVEEYLDSVPKDDPELDWEFSEVGQFGEDGWTISYSHKSVEKDD